MIKVEMFFEQSPDRLYFTIAEVAELFQVNQSLLRYWEKEFELLQPKKSAKGNRLFSRADIGILKQIYQLVKEEGFTLQGAKERLKMNAYLKGNFKTNLMPNSIANSNQEVVETLKELKKILLEIKGNLD